MGRRVLLTVMASQDPQLLIRALVFAAHKHRLQRRKGGDGKTPYINHPIEIIAVLSDIASVDDAAVLAAAALHDTIEDTATTREELEHQFGTTVAGFVMELTDDKTLPNEQRKQDQIDHASHTSAGAALVKIADKICNVRDIMVRPPAGWGEQRQHAYFVWAKLVVDGLPPTHPALVHAFDAAYQQAMQSLKANSGD